MKDKRLLVSVPKVSGRSFYLHQPATGSDWFIKFTPPKRARHGSRPHVPARVERSTGTRELAAAKRIAADIITSFFLIGDEGKSAELLKARSNFITIGELLAVYEKRGVEKKATKDDYAQSLCMMVRTVHGDDPAVRSTAVLTKELTREFERRRMEARLTSERILSARLQEGARDLELRLAVATQQVRQSTASYVRQAKAVVGVEKMKFYEGLCLPDLSEFRAERVEKPRKSRPRPLDLNALTAMEAARPALIGKMGKDAEGRPIFPSEQNGGGCDPGSYVANLMFSRWALRDIEILNARTWWITGETSNVELRTSNFQLHIIDRPEENFFPKGCEGSFEIDAEVVAEVLRFQHLCVDGYLIPGKTMTDRHKAIYRRHSRWVSTWIRDHRKTSYELRRYAGSRLLDMGATIFQVRDFLRHRDSKTTEDWYAYRLKNRKLPTIGLRNLVPEGACA